ncbi:putative exported domain protein [Bacteroides fragilis str. Korea 419]|nr:putative exported domain protein [Bacteroides fragilis str. Korea 419]
MFFYGSGTFESGLIAKCNQKKVLNQYLPFPQTEQAVNRDVNYLLFQGGSYYEAG